MKTHIADNYDVLPITIERAQDVWLWDTEGRRYLDMMSAYSAISHGHLHPRVVAAAQRQLTQVAVSSRAFGVATLEAFLEKLCQVAGLDQALPMNSGAEAVETAIKAVRRWGYRVKGIAPDRAEIAVARGNFHGRTTTVISASTNPAYRADFGPFTPGFKHFDFGDLRSVESVLGRNTCAVLVEPIQGEAGIIVPPDGFLRELRALCDDHGVLLVLDEIQSGLGRTGRWFAFQHEDIRPDAVLVGKALGGGLLPVSAMVGTDALMSVFTPGSHGSTFGGNALAAAVGLEALRVLEDEQLIERSALLGEHLLARLRALPSPAIQEVRGRGLWAGLQFRADQVHAKTFIERLAQRGVLTRETQDTVIRIAPPLTISQADLDWGIDRIAETLESFVPNAGVSGRSAPATRAAQPSPATHSQPAPAPVTLPRLMMCPPTHFRVSYEINPWMNIERWQAEAQHLRAEAQQGWAALQAVYERLGARIDLEPPQPDLPDMVFTANSGFVLDGKVLVSRFRHPERAPEATHAREFFERLRVQGLVSAVDDAPEGECFEGAGDAIWDDTRHMIWMGWGQRSTRGMKAVLEHHYGYPVVALELADPRFYHLDTSFCVLSGGEVIAYRPAFSPSSWSLLRALLGDPLLEAGDEDALNLGVNSVCFGPHVVMCHCSTTLRGRLEALGYTVHLVPLSAFNRSGGAVYCLTLRLDQVGLKAPRGLIESRSRARDTVK